MRSTNYNKILEDHEVLLFVQKGDQFAFEVLYNRFRPQVYHTAFQFLKSSDLAKEVVQDVFLKIWLDRENLDTVLSIKAWIYKLSKNIILNKIKRLAIESKAKEYFKIHYSDEDFVTMQVLENREYHLLIQEAIHSLPVQQRKVFELAKYEKLSYEAIAKELELSPLTVKTHMARALSNLRTKLLKIGVEIPIFLFFLEDFF